MLRRRYSFKLLPVILFLLTTWSHADTLTLADVYRKAEQNFPLTKKNLLHDKSLELSLENLTSSWFPEIKAMGLATYQSDVVSLPFSVPGAEPLNLPHERLQAYLDVTQVIYDGGMNRVKRDLQNRENQINRQQTEVSLQQLKEQVITTYFSLLVSRSTESIFLNSLGLLNEKLRLMQDALDDGIGDELTVLKLRAEVVGVEQKLEAIRFQHKSLIKVLSLLMGEVVDSNAVFVSPHREVIPEGELLRPELKLFSLQQEKLRASASVQQAVRRPKISAFAQGGAGYPNPFNFFDDTFSPYYLFGVRLSWNALDWGNAQREQDMLMIQAEMLGTEKENLQKNLDIQLAQLLQRIHELEQTLEQDRELIRINKKILELASMQFDEETISYAEFIESMNQEQAAMLNYELHKTQLEMAKANLLNQQGTFFTSNNLSK